MASAPIADPPAADDRASSDLPPLFRRHVRRPRLTRQLDESKAREVIEKRTHKAAVDADWEKSRQYGVTGVPTYVFGDRGVVGAQPYEALEELVRA